MNLDPKQTEAFRAVINSGSFEQAALRLHLTPPAISQRVRALESALGNALVVRSLTQSRDDLMIMSQVPQDMALDFMPFLENPIIAVAPPDHPLCEADSLQLQPASCPSRPIPLTMMTRRTKSPSPSRSQPA